MTRPVIGITTQWDRDSGRYMLRDCYCDMVAMAHGEPVLLPYCSDRTDFLDGVIFSGGGDISPKLGGYEDGAMMCYDAPSRDGSERRLFEMARQCALPVLGICRGMQLVNCLLGGTLVRDLAESGIGGAHHGVADFAEHTITTAENSLMRSFYGAENRVLSRHHQAVKTLGSGLRACAWSDDGVIEAAEHESSDILLLQFHPERMENLSVFRWLTECAQRKA